MEKEKIKKNPPNSFLTIKLTRTTADQHKFIPPRMYKPNATIILKNGS